MSVGHSHPAVSAAAAAQAQRLQHVSLFGASPPVARMAEALAKHAPTGLDQCFFAASGSEANEIALDIAESRSGCADVLALRHGYSGRTRATRSISGQSRVRPRRGAASSAALAPAPYCYRCPFGRTYPSCDLACARDLEEVIDTATGGRIGAMIVEPILGVGGCVPLPRGYLPLAAEIVRRRGGSIVVDEVQTGMGRTGRMWGVEHHEVAPDLVTVGKGVANGLPLAACLATADASASYASAAISTFGANLVSCAAGLAVFDVFREERVLENVRARSAELEASLRELQAAFPRSVGDVRGAGLLYGLELVLDETEGDRTPDPALCSRLHASCQREGLIVGKGGTYGNVLRLSPPLTIGAGDTLAAVEILERALRSCTPP